MPPRQSHGVQIDIPARLNLADEILRRAMDSGLADRPAVYSQDQVLTYRELDEKASRLAGGLRKMGIEATDRVLLRFPNRPDFVVAWFALQKLGAVVLATMPLLRARELEYVANDSEVKTALVSSDLLEELDKARPKFTTVQQVVVAGGKGSDSESFEELCSAEPARSVEVGCNDPALIAYTSGSTGVPKGCVHFPSDVLASADTYGKEVLAPEPGDIFTGHPPLAFTFGLGGLLVYPLRFGAATCLIERFTPETMLETISRFRDAGGGREEALRSRKPPGSGERR
jgi:2-aminobenzoate-CoA ligase